VRLRRRCGAALRAGGLVLPGELVEFDAPNRVVCLNRLTVDGELVFQSRLVYSLTTALPDSTLVDKRLHSRVPRRDGRQRGRVAGAHAAGTGSHRRVIDPVVRICVLIDVETEVGSGRVSRPGATDRTGVSAAVQRSTGNLRCRCPQVTTV